MIQPARLHAIVWKEFAQLRRDPMTIGVLFGIPVLQLLLFGYAIQTEVRNLPTGVFDQANTSDSRALVQAFQATDNFDVVRHAASRVQLEQWIGAGVVRAGLVIPPDFSRRLKRREPAPVQVLIDAADPLASQSAIAAAVAVGQERSLKALASAVGASTPPGAAAPPSRTARLAGAMPALDVRVRPLFNPGLRTAVYIVPGIIGVLLSLTMMMITAVAIVRERERGTLEQLIV
ncbi:MAG: ABC transporter permease, partial [Gemmatimonadetes bacterium]|nr:ABC transporter permease [Gemmatimonadota bacterium]